MWLCPWGAYLVEEVVETDGLCTEQRSHGALWPLEARVQLGNIGLPWRLLCCSFFPLEASFLLNSPLGLPPYLHYLPRVALLRGRERAFCVGSAPFLASLARKWLVSYHAKRCKLAATIQGQFLQNQCARRAMMRTLYHGITVRLLHSTTELPFENIVHYSLAHNF